MTKDDYLETREEHKRMMSMDRTDELRGAELLATARPEAFGGVMEEVMRARGIEATPERVREIAEQSGLDAEDFLAAMEDYRKPGYMASLKRLADVLSLTEREKTMVAKAYTFGLRNSAEDLRQL